MKSSLLSVLVSALLLPFVSSAEWDPPEGYNCLAVAEFAPVPPSIDGVLDELWDAATAYPISIPLAERVFAGTDGLNVHFKALWDHERFYLVVYGQDVGMSALEAGHYELFLSTAYTRVYGQWGAPGLDLFDFQLNNHLFGANQSTYVHGLYSDVGAPLTSYVRANVVTGDSFVSELSIHWDDLGGLPLDLEENRAFDQNPDYFGFAIQYQRGPVGGTRTEMGWCNTVDEAWADTSIWGTMRLAPLGTEEPPPPPTCESTHFSSAYTAALGECWFYNGFLGYFYAAFEPFLYTFGSSEGGLAAGWHYIVAAGEDDADGFYTYDFTGDRWGFSFGSIYPFATWY